MITAGSYTKGIIMLLVKTEKKLEACKRCYNPNTASD